MEEEKEVKETRKEKKGKSIVGKIINFVLWVVIFAWMGVCLVDFYNTQTEKEPKFTFKEETHTYDDGDVKIYTGLGYKIFYYNRKSYNAIQYGPFWLKDRFEEEK